MAKVFTLSDYYKGRDKAYVKDLTPTIKANAERTVKNLNALMQAMEKDGVDTSDLTINSGWRPNAVNAQTPGADPNSPHVTAEGVDVGDRSGKVRAWVGKNPDKVKAAGFVATEDFSITKTWCHLQTRPPLSWQKGKVIWLAIAGGWRNNFSKVIKKILS